LIRYLKHSEIDRQLWDECIAASPHPLVYAESWFLDIVSPQWDGLIEDNYIAVFPLTHRRKAGIEYLFQPYFTQQLGLFSKDKKFSEKKLDEFLTLIPDKFRLIEIQLNCSNVNCNAEGFRIKNKITHHLDLSPEYQKINSGYSENLKRNIKKANRYELNENSDVSPGDIIELFRKNKGAEIDNLKNSDYDTFRKLISEGDHRNLIYCEGILNTKRKLIAGAIFLKSADSYIFLFSATGEEAKEKGAMSFLIDRFIARHSTENKILDFEGSMNVNLARFYKSFGSQEIVYLQIFKNNLPKIIRWLK
jgi:hypothetical protein